MSSNWGPRTWALFHTITMQIDRNHFPAKKEELISIMKKISNTLPCPTCASHATEFWTSINTRNIRTKEDFQNMMHFFHNEVNKGIKKECPPLEILEQYKNVNLSFIIQDFLNMYTKYSNIHNNSFKRTLIVNEIKTFFRQNLHIFKAVN